MTAAVQSGLYDDLDTLTILALAAVLHDKKGFLKVAVKMLKRVSPQTASAIVKQVLDSPRYKTAIHAHLWRYLNITRCAQEIGQDRQNQGMIIYQDEVYPLQIEVESAEDRPWAIKHQAEVQLRAVEGLMKLVEKDHVYCHVLLFSNRGFNGIVREFELKREPNSDQTRCIGDTHFYY